VESSPTSAHSRLGCRDDEAVLTATFDVSVRRSDLEAGASAVDQRFTDGDRIQSFVASFLPALGAQDVRVSEAAILASGTEYELLRDGSLVALLTVERPDDTPVISGLQGCESVIAAAREGATAG
jgi:hypothetical protein